MCTLCYWSYDHEVTGHVVRNSVLCATDSCSHFTTMWTMSYLVLKHNMLCH